MPAAPPSSKPTLAPAVCAWPEPSAGSRREARPSLLNMCGIVGVLSRPSLRQPPDARAVLAALDEALGALGAPAEAQPDRLSDATDRLRDVDHSLSGVPGVLALVRQDGLDTGIRQRLERFDAIVRAIDERIETAGPELDAGAVETLNATLVGLRDVLWAIGHDRLRSAAAVADLTGPDATEAAIAGFMAIQIALSALDRLEVRGRDSAGLHLLVSNHGLDLDVASRRAEIARRSADPLFGSGAVRATDGRLAFVYKAAAEIGELGDNTSVLRAAMRADELLHEALSGVDALVTVLGHTRWASVGIISEPNAHPVNSDELEVAAAAAGPYVAAALNGDVDNYADLKVTNGLRLHAEITTDAKVIPTLVSRAATGVGLVEAFRRSVSTFDGSVAIAATSAAEPDQLVVGLRGSGQGLYVGLADDNFVVSSEPYGLVEETPRYLRLDGETPAHSDQPMSRGQVVVLDRAGAGTVAGITRLAYDGTPLPVSERDLSRAEITTRDIDRGDAPHFLLKEIGEAPGSVRKTLRGRLREIDGELKVTLGSGTLTPAVTDLLTSGRLRRVVVIGQGTAAVAGSSMAAVLTGLLAGSDVAVAVDTMTATEFSGFHLGTDLSGLSGTLVVAVSQSGTTTDTNRTVDLARERGATVIGIVNRRNSDLADKADGVLFTSDGRDVEMSVASTKAFYAQVAAGVLLACTIAEHVGVADDGRRASLLAALRQLPDAMSAVGGEREAIADAARRLATSRRHWAVVGNGPNAVAAQEVRIKLSELCYKSIACDVTEDKKHIDLSSEPLILVCAAGLAGSNVDDVAKEVAIYRAHKAAPIVIATAGEERFASALAVLRVPETDPRLAFVLSAMAGHLFGYEAALSIDALARPLRQARAAIDAAVSGAPSGEVALQRLARRVGPIAAQFSDSLRAGTYDGCLEASTATRLATVMQFATGLLPLDLYELFDGKQATPDTVVVDLNVALTKAIDELTRPIDAIKHQAKTVTVGISRSDEGLLSVRLVAEVLAAGAGRDLLTYKTLKMIASLDPAVVAVLGATRYRITGDADDDSATIEVVDKTGIARDLVSRIERQPGAPLYGTKRRVASEREPFVAAGRSDGRLVMLVPEVKGSHTVGITLLHVQLADRLPAEVARSVLQGYRQRYELLADWVTETEQTFLEERLGEIPVVELLTLPVTELADRWR